MARAMSVYTQNGTDYIINDPNNADEFVTSRAWNAGEPCYHGGDLYVFTADHPINTAWSGTDVRKIKLGEEVSGLKSAITHQNNAQTGLNVRDISFINSEKAKNKEQDIKINSLKVNDQRNKSALTAVWYSLLNTDENELLLSENNWLAIVQYECRDERFDGLSERVDDLKSALEQQNNAQTGICGKEYQDRNGFIQKNKEQDLKIGSLEVNEQRFKQALTPVWHELQNTDENEIWIADNTWISVVVYECRDNRLIGYVEELTATDEALSDRINANAEEIEDAEERVNTRIDELHKDDFDPFKVGLPVLKMFGDFNTMTKSSGKTIEYYYYKTGSQLINNRELLTTIELIASGTGNCKWQGQSSINLPKKNFTVTFSKPISHEGWFMGRKAVLKGNYNDATFARNVVSAKLWGDVVRSRSDIDTSPILDTDSNELLIEADNPVLIYAVPLYGCVNGAAIDGFPILVEINGEYAGIYDFTLKKGEKETTFMGGNQYEAVVGAEVDSEPVRFRAEAACDGTDFEIEYASDNFTDEAIAESINAAIDACLNHASTEQEYRDNVCTKIDIDSAIDYWIFSQLIQNWDGVSKNYLLITYDGTKWYFSAYDLDHTFGNIILNKEVPKVDKANTGFMYFANINRLFNRISKYDMDKVIARFNELVEGALSENNIMVSFSSFIGSIPKLAVDKETHVWPLEYWSNMQTYDQITNFYRLRKDYIRKQVAELAEGE